MAPQWMFLCSPTASPKQQAGSAHTGHKASSSMASGWSLLVDRSSSSMLSWNQMIYYN